ncbi:hypothetical protein Glove_146g62 [Diversispora epigaea]|uniref:Uncharacterized protein n=1 Tax=Diversispora epigaea TaxID=1348612 RepID=A0A397IXR9_9GLOM|nr:hypothetical protein Glove_146g62 [Diversispora epigaea]
MYADVSYRNDIILEKKIKNNHFMRKAIINNTLNEKIHGYKNYNRANHRIFFSRILFQLGFLGIEYLSLENNFRELITDLDLPFEFKILCEFLTSHYGKIQYTHKAAIGVVPKRTILSQTNINFEIVIKLRLTSHNPELRIHKINSLHGKDITMIPDTIFVTSVIVNISNDVMPTCETKYITVRNEIRIKMAFERS